MTARKHLTILAVLAMLLTLALPRRLLAQEAPGEKPFHGQIEIGVRALVGDSDAAKFREYRHIPSGFFVRNADLRSDNLMGKNYFLDFQARETIEKDQAYLLGLGKYGKFRLQGRWDQTPHLFTNVAKTFFTTPSTEGVYRVPSSIITAIQNDPTVASATSSILAPMRPVEVGLRRDTGSIALAITPTAHWSVFAGYSHEKQSGVRPFGTTMYFTYTIELPEPVHYRTQQGRVGVEYASERGAFQATYLTSGFENRVSAIVWDNPFQTACSGTPVVCTPYFTPKVDKPLSGQLDLYPDNRAHNLTFAGAYNLGKSVRLLASITPGWMFQNSALLPYTTNTGIAGVPNVLPQPTSSPGRFDGSRRTLAMNYTVAARPVKGVGLTARFRSYDYDNDSPSLTFPTYVASDMHLSTASCPGLPNVSPCTDVLGGTIPAGGAFYVARRNLPFAFSRKTTSADATWIFKKNNSFKFSYEFERMDRHHRDVELSDEHTFGPSLDLNPTKWLLFRASYKRSLLTPEDYEVNEEGFPNGEGVILQGTRLFLGQMEEARKYDEAHRNRDRADLLLQITPLDNLMFSAVYGTVQDQFARTHNGEELYGLLHDINYNFGFEATYSPVVPVLLYANYTREKFNTLQLSRQRNPAGYSTVTRIVTPANDSELNDWISWNRDWVDTWATGINLSLAKNKLLVDSYYSLSVVNSTNLTQALGRWATATGATNPLFVATTACTKNTDGSCGPLNLPDSGSRYHQLTNSIRYRLPHGLTPRFEYRFERWDRNDYQFGVMQPYMFSVDSSLRTSVFLGADVPRYNTHILSFSLGYTF